MSCTLCIALALRLAAVPWGIGLGPNEGFYHPDESKVWSSTLQFPHNVLNNTNFLYGTTLQYSLAILLAPVRFVWTWVIPSPAELSQIQFVIIASRVVSCCLGAGCVFLVYRLGRQLCDERTGHIAAALLSVSFYHCLNSALTTLDVSMSFFATSLIVLTWQVAQSGAMRDFVWLGLVTGYLVGGKISGVMFLVFPVLLTWEILRQKPTDESVPAGPRQQWISLSTWRRGLTLSTLIAGILLLASMPYILLHLRTYLQFMATQQHQWFDRADHSIVGMTQGWIAALWTALNPISFGLAFVGLVLASVRIPDPVRPLHRGILAVLVCHVIFWRGYVSPRFVIVLAPLLSVYAAYGVSNMLRANNVWMRRGGVVVLVMALTEGTVICLAGLYDRYHDTRTECAAYLAQEIQPHERIALLQRTERDSQKHAWRYPRVVNFECVKVLDSPDVILTSSYVTNMLRKALDSGEMSDDFVWPEEKRAFWPQYLAPDPDELRFADRLFRGTSEYDLIQIWRPSSYVIPEFGSPELRLYRRN